MQPCKARQVCCDFPLLTIEGTVLTILQSSIISWESFCSHTLTLGVGALLGIPNVLTVETPQRAAKGFSNWLQHSDLTPS